jgi:hypothetical protein
MQRNIRIKSASFVYAPGMFRWVRESIAPFGEKKAIEVLEALGLEQADAKALANPKQEVKTTIEGEDLLLEFNTYQPIMTESQILAIRCAYADLQGALEAYECEGGDSHDWEAHALSIQELAEQFPDILETQNTQNTKPTIYNEEEYDGPTEQQIEEEMIARDIERQEEDYRRLKQALGSPALAKACLDDFDYALRLKSGEVIRFTSAEWHGNGWLTLNGIDPAEDFRPPHRQDLPFPADRGVDVRLDDILWVMDAPCGS